MNVVLQERDLDVLRSLVVAVRLLTLRQVAKLRHAGLSNTRKRMAKLRDMCLVAAIRVFAQSPPDISKPIHVWNMGDPLPPAQKVSYAARKRYRNRPPKEMTAYVPTNRTLSMLGFASKRGSSDRPVLRFKAHQCTHDIGLAAVYVEHKHRWPKDAWRGEDMFERGFREKKEDAIILGPERNIDQPILAVDYLCKYGPRRIEELSHALADKNLPFWFF